MRILLVEDEKRMAQALCEILRLEKYEVDHFSDGKTGLAAVGNPCKVVRKITAEDKIKR